MPAITEREVKLAFSSAGEARAALAAAGAVPMRARRLQHDALYDTADGRLAARRIVVRLRTEPDGCTLTFKGPAEAGGVMKVREEAETTLPDPEAVRRVFEALGLRPTFRYEKFREEFEAPGVVAAVDETPVGTWVEIEGTEHGILDLAARLGRGPDDFVRASYRRLFLDLGAKAGIAGPDMLFARA